MAIWYVRKSGSDSNNGQTAATAFRTITKVLSAGVVSSGDTVWIGAGVYRENIICQMTSPISQIYIIGDVTGNNTGDSGEIQLTSYLINDESKSNVVVSLLNFNGKSFLTFQNISFVHYSPPTGGSTAISATTTTSTNIQFINCIFLFSNNGITMTNVSSTSFNWLFSGCIFMSGTSTMITINIATANTTDYNINVIIDNCIFFVNNNPYINITKTGALSHFGGGILIRNCFFTGAAAAITVGASISSLYPTQVYNCIFFNAGLSANTLGQIIENNNVFYSNSPRTNVAIGFQSVSDNSMSPLFSFGQELFYGGKLKPFGMPYNNSPFLCHGDITISPTTDLLGHIRPCGDVYFVDSGICSSGNLIGTFYDYTKNWNISGYDGFTLKMMNGPASGLAKTINYNSGSFMQVDGKWPIIPLTGNKYQIFQGPTYLNSVVSSGINLSTTGAVLVDNYAQWGSSFWNGYTCLITSGFASGQWITIGNTSGSSVTTLQSISGQTWNVLPASGDLYTLYWSGSGNGISGSPIINTTVGTYSIWNTAIKDTTNYISGNNSIKLCGPAIQDFQIPISGSGISTTISCYSMYDDYYKGTLPQLSIKDAQYIGIQDITGTLGVSPNTWGQISITVIPSGQGYLTARCISNTTGIGSNCWFDAFNVI